MSTKPKLPWWLKPMNRVILPLNRLGLVLGDMHILSIPVGRAASCAARRCPC